MTAHRFLLPMLALLAASLATAAPSRAWTWLQPDPEAPRARADDAGAEAPWQEPPAARDHMQGGNYNDFAPEPSLPGHAGEDGICLREILAAERRHGIPDHLLLALGLQEAGWQGPRGLTVWPWSVNAAGEGRRFKTSTAALAFVLERKAAGVRSIDVGCMQINLHWHPDAFDMLSEGFDARRNVDYAARFLTELHDQTGDWWEAAGRYHSATPEHQARYLGQLQRNHQVALARIEQFAALAGDAGGFDSLSSLPRLADAAPIRPGLRNPGTWHEDGAMWGAALAGDGGQGRTLYSAETIQPILPNFIESEL